jgi:hypothetical protein
MPSPERVHPAVPCLLAWLVPGAGHLRIGRHWPATFVAATVLGLFVSGMALAGFENVSHVRHEWYFALHVLAGLPTLAADLLTADVVPTERLPHRTVGELYTAMAGLLNLVAVADVWARCSQGDPEERRARADAAAAPPGTAADLVAPPAPSPAPSPPSPPAEDSGARG